MARGGASQARDRAQMLANQRGEDCHYDLRRQAARVMATHAVGDDEQSLLPIHEEGVFVFRTHPATVGEAEAIELARLLSSAPAL